MDQQHKTYVRPFRRRFGLSQRELAFLIGAKSGSVVSRIERGQLTPNLTFARAFALVFGTRAVDLFPGLFSDIQGQVLHRVNDLYEELQGNRSKTTRIKLDFLEGVMARLDGKRIDIDI